MHAHERPPICQFVISRDTIRISRVARIACVLAVRLENLEQFEKAIILVIIVRAILRHSFDRTCNGNIVSSSFANTQTDDDFLTRVEDAFYLFGIGDY